MNGRQRRAPSERCSHCGSFFKPGHVCDTDNSNFPKTKSSTPGRVKPRRQLDKLLTDAEAEMGGGRGNKSIEQQQQRAREGEGRQRRGGQPKGRGRGRGQGRASVVPTLLLPPTHTEQQLPQCRQVWKPVFGTRRVSASTSFTPASASVAQPSSSCASANAQRVQPDDPLDWLMENWDALPEMQVKNVEKWLLAKNDTPLPPVVVGIHNEYHQWLAEGEGQSVDDWVAMLGGTVDSDHTATVPSPAHAPATAPVVNSTAKVVVESQPVVDMADRCQLYS